MEITTRNLNLITECIDGDRSAQKQLYNLYRVKMYTLCLRYMSNTTDAEDMMQEGWVKVFKMLHTYDSSKGSFYGWIRKIFVNTNLEHIRKKKIQFENIDDFQVNGYNGESTAISDMTMQEMVKLLQELPAGYRSVFNMYVIEGYTHREISEQLGISVSTSKTQLMKAKQSMQVKTLSLQIA